MYNKLIEWADAPSPKFLIIYYSCLVFSSEKLSWNLLIVWLANLQVDMNTLSTDMNTHRLHNLGHELLEITSSLNASDWISWLSATSDKSYQNVIAYQKTCKCHQKMEFLQKFYRHLAAVIIKNCYHQVLWVSLRPQNDLQEISNLADVQS